MKNMITMLVAALTLAACGKEEGAGAACDQYVAEVCECYGDTSAECETATGAVADASDSACEEEVAKFKCGGGGGGGSTPEVFTPVAVGVTLRGIWNEAAGTLDPYVVSAEDASDGVAFAQDPYVMVTFATSDYFGEDETQQEQEMCEVVAFFGGSVSANGTITDPVVYDMDAQEFDWDAGAGGNGVSVDEWQAWEGGLVFALDTATERCQYADVDLNLFQGMHLGIGFGPQSTYQAETLGESDDWDAEEDGPAYFTAYIAMNHPTADGGYDFVGYDWNPTYYSEVDPSICFEREGEEGEEPEEICGGIVVDDEGLLVPGDQDANVGSRLGYVTAYSWWYEDFPNLDLNLMGEGFDWLYEEGGEEGGE